MKNLLLTCFLALPCLFGSPPSVQSQVAESPGANLLHSFGSPFVSPHSGDSHRGGPFTRPDSFTPLDPWAESNDEAIYTTEVSAIDGGPTLQSLVLSTLPTRVGKFEASVACTEHLTNESWEVRSARLPASNKGTALLRAFARGDDPEHRTSDTQHRTSLRSTVSRLPASLELNFGLVDSDQDMRVGLEASRLQSPSFPVLSSQIKQGLARQDPESQSLASNVLHLTSSLVDGDQDMGAGEGTSSLQPAPVTVSTSPNHSGSKALWQKSTESQSLVSSVLSLASKKSSSVPVSASQVDSGRKETPLQTEALSLASNDPAPVIIYGELVDFDPLDSIELHFWPELYHPNSKDLGPQVWKTVANRSNLFQSFQVYDRQFRFEIPEISQPGYLSLSMGNRVFVDTYLVMPGDSIMIRIDRTTNQTVFTGPSSDSFRCQQEIKALAYQRKLATPKRFDLSLTGTLDEEQKKLWEMSEKDFGRKSILIKSKEEMLAYLENQVAELEDTPYLEILERYRRGLTENQYKLIKAGALAQERFKIPYSFYKYDFPAVEKSGDPLLINEYRDFFNRWIASLAEYTQEEDLLTLSYDYMRLRDAIARSKALVEHSSFVEVTKGVSSPAIQGKLLVNYFIYNLKHILNWETLLPEAIASTSAEPYLEVLTDLFYRNQEGSPIPEARLLTLNGESFSLDSLRGKVVLMEFWLSGCKACLGFRPDLIRIAEEFTPSGEFVIVSVPIDRNPQLWKASIASGAYDLPNQITLHTGGLGSAHPFPAYYNITSFPHVLIIDRNGKLVRSGVYRATYDYVAKELVKLIDTNSLNRSDSNPTIN